MTELTPGDLPTGAERTRSAPARFRRAAWISGLVTAGATLLVVFIFRGRLDAVDENRLSAASELWRTAGIRDYDLHLHVTNRQRDDYRIQVRDGEVQRVVLNGNELTRRHSFPAWSVEGMLETIRRDLENHRRYERGERGRDVCQLLIRGRFHRQLGYPEKYIRMPRGGGNLQPTISWELVRFSIANDAIANSGPDD